MPTDKPRVSIGIPVFNGEKYLREVVDSLLAQTYTDFELIFSDNASTDRTQTICREYAQKDRRVRYHRNEENLGAAPNHNMVFSLATGEYFMWAGYDDKFSREYLAKCVEVLDNHPDVVLCMTDRRLIDDRGEYIGEPEYSIGADSPDPYNRFRNFVLHNLTGDYVYGLTRSKAIGQSTLHGSYPSSDLVYIAELTLYGKFHVIPERLFSRRKHPEQSTKGALARERDRVSWFDSSMQGKIIFPKWLFLIGLVKAIRQAPLTGFERARCYAFLFRWAFFTRAVRSLVKDFLMAGLQAGSRIVRIASRKDASS